MVGVALGERGGDAGGVFPVAGRGGVEVQPVAEAERLARPP